MDSIEIFTGCGGMALGLSRAGLSHRVMVEWNRDAVETANHNKALGIRHVEHWPVRHADVRSVDWAPHAGSVGLLAGGPPCQPFAIGGKKAGHEDVRDMWPEAVRAVRELRPRVFAFENVRNLSGPRFRPYLEWVTTHLAHPRHPRDAGETHGQHVARLTASGRAPCYRVGWQLVNAADHGAAQVRFRVILIGFREDLGIAHAHMPPTHSRDRLLWDQWITGAYWERHGMARPAGPDNPGDRTRVARLAKGPAPDTSPWVTVRDAIAGLGDPDGKRNHVHQPGARRYPGHTGSPLDMPSKALKAGDHGVPGGENMMVLSDGGVRYYTTREAARLVGMPDDYEFPRSWSESMRQLGNAVPVPLGEAVGRYVMTLAGGMPARVGLAMEREAA